MIQTLFLSIFITLVQLSYSCEIYHQPLSLLQLAYIAAEVSIKDEFPSFYSDTADKLLPFEEIKKTFKKISTTLDSTMEIDFYNEPLKTAITHPIYQGLLQARLRTAISANPQFYEKELLHAVRIQNFSLATLLIRSGTTINGASPGGNTVLHMATSFSSMQAVSFIEFLLQQKEINIMCVNQTGLTPFASAMGYSKKHPTKQEYKLMADLLKKDESLRAKRSHRCNCTLY